MKSITAFVVRAVDLSTRHAWPVIVVSLLLTLLACWYAATHFAMTTDINQLISSHMAWRQREAAFEKAFPQFETIVAVVDAPTPELVDEATGALVERLSQQKNLISSIEQPKGGSFFAQNGLLFEKVSDLAPQMTALTQAQRLVQVLAGDPTLRGVIQVLQFGLLGVQGGELTLDKMTWPLNLAAASVEKINAGQPASFSWHELAQGRASTSSDLLRFLIIRATLDYSKLEPGEEATDAIRHAAADLDFGAKYQARVRLTGPVPMADEEFATIKENAGLNASVTVAIVLVILWLALRWFRIIFAVFACLVVGLSITAAVGLLMVGTLNLISVDFAVLFVGLGVDFGIQFSVRYRAERHEIDDVRGALLASRTTRRRAVDACGTRHRRGFSVVSADRLQRRVRTRPDRRLRHADRLRDQHHAVAGAVALLKPPREPAQLGYAVLAPVDDFLARHRVPILIVTGLVVVAGLPLLYWLRFDFNPINLRSPKVESVATYLELIKDDRKAAPTISRCSSRRLPPPTRRRAKLRALPQVARAITLSTFIPDDQQQKLSLIDRRGEDAGACAQSGGADAAADRCAECQHDEFDHHVPQPACRQPRPGPAPLPRGGWPAAMAALAKADPAVRQRAEAVFVQPLRTALEDLRNLFKAKEITRDNLPPRLARQWVTPDGQARIEVAPAGDANNNAILQRVRGRRSVAWRRTRSRDRYRFSRRAAPSSSLSSRPASARWFRSASSC